MPEATTRTPASKPGRKATAARAEAKGAAPKPVSFRGLKLKLPKELPAEIAFDMVEAETAGESPVPTLRLLRSVLGQEQFAEVRNKIAGDAEATNDFGKLIDDIFDRYGMSSGESEASQDS